MTKRELSEEQFARLVAAVAKIVREQLEASQSGVAERDEDSPEAAVRRGRPKSIYTGQLHIKVLPEDAEWFKNTSDSMGLQRGSFLSMLRKSFNWS